MAAVEFRSGMARVRNGRYCLSLPGKDNFISNTVPTLNACVQRRRVSCSKTAARITRQSWEVVFPDGRARVFVPMIVEPKNIASCFGHPHQLRNGISQGMELEFACLQSGLRALALGDLFSRNVDTDNFAGWTAQRMPISDLPQFDPRAEREPRCQSRARQSL